MFTSLTRKTFLLLFIGIVVLLFVQHPILAATFDEAYQGYLSIYENYKTAYQAYTTTRNQYLTYQTLTSQNEALIAVRDFLIKRDAVFSSYLGLLSKKNTDPVLGSLLTTEMNFLVSHSASVSALGSLEDAVTSSQQVENKNTNWLILSKKIVANTLMSKINSIKLSVSQSTNEANTLIVTLKNNGKDVSVLERWLLESKNKQALAQQKLAQSAVLISNISGTNENDIGKKYDEITTIILEANQYLKEALGFLKEMSETIKYGEY